MEASMESFKNSNASTPIGEEPSETVVSVNEHDFYRSGVLLLAKTETDGSEILCSGTLTLSRARPPDYGPVISWTQDPQNPAVGGGGSDDSCGSLPEREWAVVNGNTKFCRSIRPISIELCELRSFRLSEDSNQLTLIQCDGTKHPPMIFLDDGPDALINAIKRYVSVKQSYLDDNLYLLTDARIDALDKSLTQLNLFDRSHTDAVYKFVTDFQKDPYTTAMSAFSKIADKLLFSPSEEDCRPPEDMAELLHKSLHLGPSLDVTTGHREDGEFEVVTSRPRMMDNLPLVHRQEPLCQLDWELHQDVDGNVMEIDDLKNKIFRGGIEHNIRNEVWKYLLGYYDFRLNHAQIAELRKKKVDEYFQMKCQWRSFTSGQEDRFSAFRERKTQIEKDVFRTDRTHPFFAGDNNKNVVLLQDILMTYVMYNFDLGYVQGMSDLLAPILYVMQNEVDAFWCFVGFMDRVSGNFDFEAGGIKHQLTLLIELLKTLDPEFYSYLDAKDSGNLFFCFRWLLIWFKREFAFTEVMGLWEVLWTDLPCQNFHLIICVALMESAKKSIIENKFGFNEILKHINDMANGIDLNRTLAKAEAIYIKLSKSPFVSNPARRIVGLPTLQLEDFQTNGALSGMSPPAALGGARRVSGGAGDRPASKPVNIVGGAKAVIYHSESSRVKRSSGQSGDSSSVEVLSDDDSNKLDHSISSFGPFE